MGLDTAFIPSSWICGPILKRGFSNKRKALTFSKYLALFWHSFMAAGRPSNIVVTETITLSTTPQVRHCLQKLASYGIFGKNVAEVANRILSNAMEDYVAKAVYLHMEDLKFQPKKTHEEQ